MTSRLNSLKFRNSLILIGVMMPLFTLFLFYEVRYQTTALRSTLTERGIVLAQTGATAAGKILGDAVKYGQLTKQQLFDKNYRLIAGTTPTKYHTLYDRYTDENLRQLEDSFLRDKVVVFAVAVDTNGYLPTHNTIYSRPGGGLNDDRTKRIFDDDVGIAAARNEKPYLLQEYRRDTGEIMWDISSPIYVNGRHWGAFRIGFSIQETNRQISAVINRMVFVGATLILVLVLLATYISSRISSRVKNLADEVNRIAQGDFSLNNLSTETTDEIGSLSKSLSNMVLKLRELAEKTRYSARLIDNYTQELLGSTENVTRASKAVTGTMVSVSEAMKNVEIGTDRVVSTSEALSADLASAEASSRKFLKNMEDSKAAMAVAHEVVKELEFQVDKVGQFIQVVSILAEQAGLMAAKIVKEAAQYCSQGNEMAALALEVQSNAEDAARTSKDVSELFSTVRDYARKASETLEGHQGVILEGITVARLSGKSLKVIVAEMGSLAQLTRDILDNSRQLVDGVAEMNVDVSAQTDIVTRFTAIAGTLEQVVDELQNTLETIKV